MPVIPAIEIYTDQEILSHTMLNTLVSSIRDTVNTYGVLTDVARTISAIQTFSAAPVFSAGFGVTGTITMATAASKIVPGVTSLSLRNNADAADNLILLDSGAATFRSTVGGITTLSCTTVTATNLGGTLSTAAQASVTSVGTLTALTIGGNLTFSGGSRLIVPGTTALTIRNVGNTADAIQVSANVVSMGTAAVDIQLGATVATTATVGLLLIPNCLGTPTGVVSDGFLVLDTTNLKLYCRLGGVWKAVTFT